MSPAFRYTALVTFVSLLPIAWHFGTVLGYWGSPPETRPELFIRLGVFIGVTIIGSVITAILMAAASGEDEFEPDEREKLILRKAELTGYYVLAAGAVMIMWFVFTPLTPMQTANALIGAFALSEVVKIVAGFFFLKRGV